MQPSPKFVPVTRNHRLHQSMANALRRSKQLNGGTLVGLSPLSARAKSRIHRSTDGGRVAANRADAVEDLLREKYDRVLEERESLRDLSRGQQEEIQSLHSRVQQLSLLVQDTGIKSAKELGDLQSHCIHLTLEASTKEANLERLQAQVDELREREQAAATAADDRQQDPAGAAVALAEHRHVASTSVHCALALMSQIDALASDKEELTSMVRSLWSRVKAQPASV